MKINRITQSKLNESCYDDEHKGEQLGESEDVLDERGPLDLPAVDECQNAWK